MNLDRTAVKYLKRAVPGGGMVKFKRTAAVIKYSQVEPIIATDDSLRSSTDQSITAGVNSSPISKSEAFAILKSAAATGMNESLGVIK